MCAEIKVGLVPLRKRLPHQYMQIFSSLTSIYNIIEITEIQYTTVATLYINLCSLRSVY